MKRIMSCISLLMFSQCCAIDNNSGIFPFPDITLGMSSKALLEKYPTKKTLFSKTNDDKILERGMLMYDIPENKFWDTLAIQIEETKIISLCYFNLNKNPLSHNLGTHDFDNVVKNVSPLFQQLRQQLGTKFEKKIRYGERGTETRCAMYIWKRENDVVAFSHSPVSQYKKGDLFECQLTVVPTYEYLGVIRQLATDSVPEDAALWADATGEEKTGGWLFLIIGVSAVIGAILAWRCFRKRKSA